jgi:putative addiction module killer protein
MVSIKRTETFNKWLSNLKDGMTKAIIVKRIDRMAEGNRGDWKSIDSDIFELRIHFGAGFRLYCKEIGSKIIILLCGGDKSTQESDIKKAKELAKDY